MLGRIATLASVGLSGLAAGAWLHLHRTSPAVQAWSAPTLATERVGALFTRTGGPTRGAGERPGDAHAVLLLHGLIATGDVFGTTIDRLAQRHVVAVPDLAGFGRSLDHHNDDFGTEAHLDAIDAVVDATFGDRRIRIGAHSMGSTLAVRWAARHPERVDRVVCVGAPVWPSEEAARAAIGGAGAMARAFTLDERVAARVCAFNCNHRRLTGWLAAGIAPRWPVPLARQASLHTWPSYRQSLEHQVLTPRWADLLDALAAAHVPVTLVWGADDTVGDVDHAVDLAASRPHVTVEVVVGDHTLPAARPELLVDLLDGD